MKQSSWTTEAALKGAAQQVCDLNWGKGVGSDVRFRFIPNEPLP